MSRTMKPLSHRAFFDPTPPPASFPYPYLGCLGGLARAPVGVNADDIPAPTVRAVGVLWGIAVPFADRARATHVDAVGACSLAQGARLRWIVQVVSHERRRRRRNGGREVDTLCRWSLKTYDFSDYGHSVVSADDFDAHWAWGGVCSGADDGHGSEEEEGSGLHDDWFIW